MVDYRKFDKLVVDDDDDEERENHLNQLSSTPSEVKENSSFGLSAGDGLSGKTSTGNPNIKMAKKGKEGRIRFEYDGRLIYEWEQSLEEVNIYINPPPGVTASMIDCNISYNHVKVGLKGAPHPFLDEDTGGTVVVDESMWMMNKMKKTANKTERTTSTDKGENVNTNLPVYELNINLQKAAKGEIWKCALKSKVQELNPTVDPYTEEEMRKKIMLERFQEENPGFDFSQAEFNGNVPDPRSFMGGIGR